MKIPTDPAKASAFKDIKNFRKNLRDPHDQEMIKGILSKRDKAKYSAKPIEEFGELDVFRDFVAWDGNPGRVKSKSRRLGGAFPEKHPNPKVPPPTRRIIAWPPHGQSQVDIHINDDGAIDHTSKTLTDEQKEAAHEYMHWIFNDILFETRKHLEAINQALEEYMNTPQSAQRDVYTDALTDFRTYEASLQPGGSSSYSGALTSAKIKPVTTNEGFIVSVRVQLHWKNPVHSSSTVKVP